jgi:hypothetical protein
VAVTIRWKIPADVKNAPNTAHTISVFRSDNGENGTYNLLDTISAGGGNTVKTYTDTSIDDRARFYLVRYTPSGGTQGSRVLALLEPVVTEQRIAEQIEGKLPEIIQARIDENLIDIRKAMKNSLDTLNAYSPQTSYTFTNLPGRFETAIVVLAMMLLYLEHQLQVGIRDYSYGATGVNFAIDRNSRFASTITNLMKAVNDLLAFTKHPDWPLEPSGLGTEALSVPQARVFSFLFQGSG